MAYFKDAQDVYDTLGKLFVDLASDGELAPKFRKANTIVRYEYTNPDSAITVRLQEGEPGDVDFGESDMEPEVTMAMAKGPVAKILKLVPLTKPVFPRYKAQLEAQGRTDLVNA